MSNRLFYLSIPPSIFVDAVRCASRRASSEQGWTRVIVEKPFGHDSKSSVELTRGLKQYLSEDQIFRYASPQLLFHLRCCSKVIDNVRTFYRIDHYLGEELIENLLVLRFANLLFEPLWSRDYIRNVQVIFSENIGIEGRGKLVQYTPCSYS